MPVYHQMGHHTQNLITVPLLSDYRGAVLSPVNNNEVEVQAQIQLARSRSNFRSILDPQLYYPNTERECLQNWSYFPQDVDTADRTSSAWWDNLTTHLSQTCARLRPHSVCSPADVPRHYADAYYDLMVQVCRMMANKLSGANVSVIQTAVVGLSELPSRVESIASILSRTPVEEIYLVLVGNTEPRRELSETEEIKAAMRLISELEESGLQVTVGFTSTDILLWKYAGATSCVSGKFFNLRRFTSSRFAEPSSGGGQIPYWVEESLVAYLRESDIIRVQNAGLFSQATIQNPFSQQIADAINAPRPWLSESWRHYLYWFADIENRINTDTADVSAILRQAEQNWRRLDDNNILMEEQRNDGSWLRPWRRAIAEFNQ